MAEQYGLTDTDELPVNVYTPTETFWVKWRKNGCFQIIKKVRAGDMVTYDETMVLQWNGRRDVMYLFNVNNVERFLAFA